MRWPRGSSYWPRPPCGCCRGSCEGREMTKWELIEAMMGRAGVVTLPDGQKGILQSVEREDGSGRSFNLRVLVDGSYVTMCVRTKD